MHTIMKKIAFLIGCALCVSTQASAQFNLLNKAKEKIQEKVETKVNDKLGKAFGKSQSSSSAASSNSSAAPSSASKPSQSSGNDDTKCYYVAEQFYSRWTNGQIFSAETANKTYNNENEGQRISHSKYHFNSTSEMLAALPAVPTAREILDQEVEGPIVDLLIHYDLARKERYDRLMQEGMENAMTQTDAMMKASNQKAQKGSSVPPQMNALIDKMTQAIMTSGLDFETASEADMMKVAVKVMSKETGIPEAEMQKLIMMAQTNPNAAMDYMKKNYPAAIKKLGITSGQAMPVVEDSDLSKFDDLFDEVSNLMSDPEAIKLSQKYSMFLIKLEPYANELLAEWPASKEFAQICAMEEELNVKLHAWMEANNTNYNDEAPDFWVEGRKAQNAVIESFNVGIATRWRDKMQNAVDDLKPYAARIASIEDRLRQASAEVSASGDLGFITRYTDSITMLGSLGFATLYTLPEQAMDAPRVCKLPEQWMP